MKFVVAIIAMLSLSACSTPEPKLASQNLVLDRHVQPMSRNEVIQAIHECQSNEMRAVTVTAKRMINGFSSDTIVDVTCAPKWKY